MFLDILASVWVFYSSPQLQVTLSYFTGGMEAATFNPVSFAEGRFRHVYKGTYTTPPSKSGKEIVVKELKDSYTWDAADWDVTLKIHEKVSELAQGFNSFSRTKYPIRFTEITVFNVTESANPISMFMHWSWVHTKGELMVADLQGVSMKGDRGGFFLTDPAIISLNNSYGPTDTGAEGMLVFFYYHKCNDFCRSLPRPTPSDFITSIPQHELRECMGKLDELQSATIYTVDLNLSPHTRQIVASVLRSVARY